MSRSIRAAGAGFMTRDGERTGGFDRRREKYNFIHHLCGIVGAGAVAKAVSKGSWLGLGRMRANRSGEWVS